MHISDLFIKLYVYIQASTLTFVRLSGTSDLVLRLSNGTSEKIPKRASTMDKSISTGIKYWVCCIKEPCLMSNSSIIYFD